MSNNKREEVEEAVGEAIYKMLQAAETGGSGAGYSVVFQPDGNGGVKVQEEESPRGARQNGMTESVPQTIDTTRKDSS